MRAESSLARSPRWGANRYGGDFGPHNPSRSRRRIWTRFRAREARDPALDVRVVDSLDGLHRSTCNPSVEVGTAYRSVPSAPEGSELAIADRVTDNANRCGRKARGLRKRNQGVVPTFAVPVGGRLTRQARQGLGDVGESLEGRGSQTATPGLSTVRPTSRRGGNSLAPAVG
jgi:hypothetical protein